MIDIDAMRAPILMAHPLPGVDDRYCFYFDETNNVRKLYLTPDGMNIRRPETFVLGGIVHRGDPRPINITKLRTELRLQVNAKELKLKHFGQGGFLDLLASPKVETFLQWLTVEDMLAHYQAIDLLYWSIVDIIDSILDEAEQPQLYPAIFLLKDALYTILREDVDVTARLLARYNYPNVGAQRRSAFIAELLDIVEACEPRLEHFAYQMLKGTLQIARGLEALPYLEEETPNLLIAGFGQFFLNRLCLFKHARHILDDEKQVEAWLEAHPLSERGAPFRHYRFANSQAEPGIQLSDPLTGLLGKLFSHVGRTPPEELEDEMDVLTSQQRRSLGLLARLVDASTDQCPGFAQHILSSEDRRRAAFVLEEVGLSI